MRKQRLAERMVEGSLKQKDLTIADLPKNRRQVYSYLIKQRFGTLFAANFLNALFWIPFFAWYFLTDFYVIEKIKTSENIGEELFGLIILEYGTMIPLFILGCIGLAGLFYIIRRMCWGESISLFYDFKKGIRQSRKQYIFIGFLAGVLIFLMQYLLRFYSLQAFDNAFTNISLSLLTLIAFLLFLILLIFIFPMSSLYQISNFMLLKGGLLFTFKYLPKNILIFLISVFPFLILVLIPSIIIKFIGIILLLFFGSINIVLIWTLYSHSIFDIHINKDEYPKYVNRGIYPTE